MPTSLPSAPHYERDVLALVVSSPDAASRVFENLCAQDFFVPLYRGLFEVAERVYRSDAPLSLDSLIAQVQAEGVDLGSNTVSSLLLSTDRFSDPDELDHMIAKLSELGALRQLAQLGTDVVATVYDKRDVAPRELIARVEDQTFEIERRVYGLRRYRENRLFSGEEYQKRREEAVSEALKRHSVEIGLAPLDRLLAYGLASEKLSVLAGRPGIGKSSVKINFIKYLCEHDVPVLSFTPEMGLVGDGWRLDALQTGIPLVEIAKMHQWSATDARKVAIEGAIRQQAAWPYYVYPDRAVSVAVISAQLRRLQRLGLHASVVFIDLFDRLRDVQVTQAKNYKVGLVLQQLSELAQEFQCHVCCLVQIRRLGRQTSAKKYKPTLEDLKDSGSFEEMADIVLLLFREGYYNKDIPDNRLEICLAKQREGIGGDSLWLPFYLKKEVMQVLPLTDRSDEGASYDTREEVREGTVSSVDDEGEIW